MIGSVALAGVLFATAVQMLRGLKDEMLSGNPDVEIYIKNGDRVLYGEKVLPRGVLTENFLNVTGSALLQISRNDTGVTPGRLIVD